MNRHHHQLVFNRARGALMAVGEGARRARKSASGQGAGAAVCWALLLGTAQAQIVADPSAPGNQRPTILTAPNGVPLVNIQTPSPAGVSLNQFSRFDVGTPGAILNNSRTATQTQLGGGVAGNPWLATGSARVIVNQVNSNNPSYLNGPIEVAGQRAEVVVANPSGIQVNGSTFINALGVTLTTGTPVFKGGSLDAYIVQRGSVGIFGGGLDTRGADYTAIFARATEVNAGLWANYLKLVNGANTVDATTHAPTGAATPIGEPPRFLLDVAHLGGMYANHIFMVGTEKGLGVNNEGVISSAASNLELHADGRLINKGALIAGGNLNVDVKGHLDNSDGHVLAAGSMHLSAQGITNDGGELQAQGNAHIDARGGDVLNRGGRIGAQGALALQAGQVSNEATADAPASIGAGGELSVRAKALHNRSAVAADGSAVHATLWSDQGMGIHTSGALSNEGRLFANGSLSVTASDITNTGTLEAASLDLSASARLHNAANASLLASDAMALSAATLDNQGLMNVAASTTGGGAGELVARVDTFNNRSGGAVFADHIAIEAGELNNRPDPGVGDAPVIAARQSLQLGVHTLNNEDGALLYSDGDIGIGGALDANAQASGQAQAVNNLSADIEAMGDIALSTVSLRNERRNVSVTQVAVIDQTAQLDMPSWWVNGKNEYGKAIEATSNHERQLYYLLDPASILSDQLIVTPDGNTVRRVEVALDPRDSIYHAASGAYAGTRGVRERVTTGAGTVVLYASVREDGVANPDQVSDAPDPLAQPLAAVTEWQTNTLSYNSAYGRCSTDCTLLVVQPGYDDPSSDLLRRDQTNLVPTHAGMEVSRTAHHTAVEDRLNPGAGATASIRAGRTMRLDIDASLTNRYADIQAGESLDVVAPDGAVANVGQTLKRTHQFHITSQTAGAGEFEWTKPEITEHLGQLGGRLHGGQNLAIDAQDLSNTDQGRSTGLAASGLDFVGVDLPSEDKPLVVGGGRLFTQAPASQVYLIETDPRFTDQRQWLSSDYLLGQLASDPAATHKRLGDGFYEQKLVREQVAELTGRRFLDEFNNDEAQLLALMDAGIAYAQAFELKPGIALTAEQMAQLTTDLVWLVQREVVLPDGTTTTALVPQVYLRAVPDGELLPSGALIAGGKVVLDIQRDLLNAGGRIEGDVLVAQAGRDITNIGGLMQARSELLASAGRNVTISSPTHTTRFSGEHVEQSRTELAGIGAIRVTGVTGDGSGSTLSIQAGQDVVLQGASVSNAGLNGTTAIEAGRDMHLQTVTVGDADSVVADARNHRHQRQSQELGSDIAALGDIHLNAGRDVVARAASVQALGDVSVQAGNDIRLEAGRATSESESSLYHKRSGPLSKKTNEEVQRQASDVALGTSFGGANVVMQAGRDIQVKGSEVNAQHLLLLDAGRDVVIASQENHESGSYFKETKQSGVSVSKQGIDYGKDEQSGSGSFSRTTQAGSGISGGDVFIVSGRDTNVQASTVVADELLSIDAARDVNLVAGVNRATSEQSSRSKSAGVNVMASGLSESITLAHDNKSNGNGSGSSAMAAASTVGSLNGDVVITAGRQYQQTGSDVLALAGDVDIEAESVAITEAREARSSTSQHNSKSTVLGATPRNALIDAIKSAETTVDTAKAASETGNSRVQAIGAAATALNAYNTVNQAAELVVDPGKMASVTIDFNLGSSKSRSESEESSDTGRASTVAGAGDVRIRAKGAGADSDILIRGSDVHAGGDALLKADGDVLLESSLDRAELHSRSDSSGASVGVGVSFGASSGITFNASANRANGNTDGQDVVQRNTRIVAGKTARIESGGDTTLAGAVVSGETVQADVGGDLLIESRQDESTFKSDQNSSGWGMSLCIPPFCYGASSVSVSGGAQNIESEYASVSEQSGLKAGDGGFQVKVHGNTTLKGGAITSTDKAIEEGKNRFEREGELTLSDVQNHARYEAQGYEVQVAVAVKGSEATAPEQQSKGTAVPAKNEGSAGIGEDSGEARSTTKAAISGVAGDSEARTGDAESGLAPIFDQGKVQQELDAQIKVTAEFGKNASKAIGD
jgi:filamentous hemagglutinin